MDLTETILNKYIIDAPSLREVLVRHGEDVARKAEEVARKHPELGLDVAFLRQAAMLHDIGVVKCDAPGIYCYGEHPYVCHGYLGHDLLMTEGLEAIARVAERHTGTGLSREDIRRQGLPLPDRDLQPETIEEQVLCYADKFFSKTHLGRERSVEQVIRSLAKFGEEGVARFRQWHALFG